MHNRKLAQKDMTALKQFGPMLFIFKDSSCILLTVKASTNEILLIFEIPSVSVEMLKLFRAQFHTL